tara:strand:- start:1199 stop:1456 length:258 start_codon:yes stop_codon:yes gene_type:complete
MYRQRFWRGGVITMTAIAGIEQTLWDLKGKHMKCPVHHIPSEGCFKIPEEPGLGIEVDEKALPLRASIAGSCPAEFLPDGTPVGA